MHTRTVERERKRERGKVATASRLNFQTSAVVVAASIAAAAVVGVSTE